MGVDTTDMRGKICMITGANSGIGYETALALAKMDATLVLVCRNQERGEKAKQTIRLESGNSDVALITADLSHRAGILSAANQFKGMYQQLHVLVNNAGAIFSDREESADGIEMTMALNHLGYFGLTHSLFDTLKATPKARVVNVASDAHRGGTLNFDDIELNNGYGMLKAYAQSKLANILFTKELDRMIQEAGADMTTNCLHPGVVATNFGKSANIFMRTMVKMIRPFVKTQLQGAETSIYLATSPDVANISGEYFADKKVATPTAAAQDMNAAYRLWQWSEEKLGI